MKKISILLLSILGLTIVSCKKTNSLNSITFMYEGKEETINKKDTYEDLASRYPSLFMTSVKSNCVNYTPYIEIINDKSKSNKNSNEYKENSESDIHYESKTYISTYNEFFAIDNSTGFTSTKRTGDIEIDNKNEINHQNVGCYYKVNDKNFDVLATNSNTLVSKIEMSEKDTLYDENISIIDVTSQKTQFNKYKINLGLRYPMPPSIYNEFNVLGDRMPLVLDMKEYGIPKSSELKDFYKSSFELTEDHIILKTEIENYNIVLGASSSDVITKSSDNNYETLKIEVWIDYKDEDYGFDYCKLEVYSKYNNEQSYSEAKTSYEIYSMDINDEEINQVKEEFIDKCKENNILDNN